VCVGGGGWQHTYTSAAALAGTQRPRSHAQTPSGLTSPQLCSPSELSQIVATSHSLGRGPPCAPPPPPPPPPPLPAPHQIDSAYQLSQTYVNLSQVRISVAPHQIDSAYQLSQTYGNLS
jgi:hypothetical protein